MPKYAQINDASVVIAHSDLSGTVDAPHMIPVGSFPEMGSTWNGATFDPPPAPDPEPQSWTALEFKRRFTAAERITMRTAATTDPIVADFLDILDTTGLSGSKVYADDADLIAGMAYMVAQGHITQLRSDEVMG